MLTPREKSPLPENVPKGVSNPRHCGSEAQALPTELFRPPSALVTSVILLYRFKRTFSDLDVGSRSQQGKAKAGWTKFWSSSQLKLW